MIDLIGIEPNPGPLSETEFKRRKFELAASQKQYSSDDFINKKCHRCHYQFSPATPNSTMIAHLNTLKCLNYECDEEST